VRWTVLVPLKSTPDAKSRLLPASVDAAAHARLVRAIRTDTVAAARDAAGVARVLLVVDRAGAAAGAEEFVQSAPGLNPALAEAAAHAMRQWPQDGVAALVGDLPALRPEELDSALAAAAARPRTFVADAAGTGTTLLAAAPDTALDPRFGAGSAARHRQVATVLPAGSGLGRDVDTATDLAAALDLGVGPATAAVLGVARPRPAE
jgi:2-phospho-L-lactate guanylyltransferase